MSAIVKPAKEIVYPESDGEPMADNLKQGRWITVLYGNLSAILDCFVGMNNFWFPVEGEPELRMAPDVFVVFGRPKGDRASYKQWEENDTPVTVVFEILSPRNRGAEMENKFHFYEEHGVEEYYIYDPDRNNLEIWVRQGSVFRRRWNVETFVSPKMGIRFDLSGPEMVVYRPDGQPFKSVEELWAEKARDAAERKQAEQRAEQAEQRAEQAEQRATSAEDRLRRGLELSRKARLGQATPDELRELGQLESQP